MDQIPSLVRSSLEAFGNLIPFFELADPVQANIVRSHFARFKLWAGTMGAHRASGMRSLTYRLRDASAIRSHVISLLEDLQGSLREGILLSSAQSSSCPCNPQLETEEANIRRAISFLESSHPADEEQYYDPIDDELAQLLGDTEHIARDGVNYHTELTRCLTQDGEIIDCLLRLSVTISNPAPHDQFKSRVDVQTTHYERYDVNHVQEKFPKLESSISHRLGRALTQRRGYFKYRQNHHLRLREGLEGDEAGRSEGDGTTETSPIPRRLFDLHIPDVPSSDLSATSYARSTTLDTSVIRVPPLPKEHADGPFLCPFCFTLIQVDTKHEWKHVKHIFRDLRPYVCIWTSCPSPGQEFQRRKDWMRHMTQEHWRQWHCPFGCSITFDGYRNLEAHLKKKHPGEVPVERLHEISLLSSRIEGEKAKGQCPLCQKFEVKTVHQYGSHIGHHLEQLALFVLPDMDESDGEDIEKENSQVKDASKRQEDRLEHGSNTEPLEPDVDKTENLPKQATIDTSSESGLSIGESLDEGIPIGSWTTQTRIYDKEARSSRSPDIEPGEREGSLRNILNHEICATRAQDDEQSLEGGGESDLRQVQKIGQEEHSRINLPRALDRLSINSDRDDYQLGKTTKVQYQYIQEKKWFCAWCHFGALDWTYDTLCLECGRARDQYCRIEYRTRKIRRS